MKIAIVRGAFLNQFEMQNFVPLAKRHELVAFSSLRPIHDQVSFPVVKLPSPMDLLNLTPMLQHNRVKRILRGVLNRALIDAHYLYGLEKALEGFDIAHCAETYYHFTQQCLRAKKKGFVKKVISTVWENLPFANERILGRKKFKKRAIEEADHFIAVTNIAKKALIAEGCKEEKITVIPMGIDLRKFEMQNAKCKITDKNEKITILFVGRFETEKGVKELLRAFKLLTINYKQLTIRLKLIGEGSLKGWVEEWAKYNQQDNNVTIEQCNYQDIPKVYQKADIFVLPSKRTKTWQEQFGMVLVEAMASSLPIVATKSGAIPEVVGKCGLLVEEQDVEGLYKALKRLVENESLRIKLGKMGRERAKKYFDSCKVAEKIEKAYQKILRE